MKLQALLQNIELTKAKLVRHNMSNEDVAVNWEQDCIDVYQSLQPPGKFGDSEYLISFRGTEGTNGVFIGCYRITGCIPFDKSMLPNGFSQVNGILDGSVYYQTEKTDILQDLENRLVIDWGKGARSWCQNGTTEKEILCILPAISDITFTSYEKVLLSYKNLKMIVDNDNDNAEWVNRLSSVAGIYLKIPWCILLLFYGSVTELEP